MVFTWSQSVHWFQRYSLLNLRVFLSPPPFTTYVCKKPYATRWLNWFWNLHLNRQPFWLVKLKLIVEVISMIYLFLFFMACHRLAYRHRRILNSWSSLLNPRQLQYIYVNYACLSWYHSAQLADVCYHLLARRTLVMRNPPMALSWSLTDLDLVGFIKIPAIRAWINRLELWIEGLMDCQKTLEIE